MMYLIGIGIFLAFVVFLTFVASGYALYIDFPSVIVILGMTIPVLMASGLIKDFVNGFKLMNQREVMFSKMEIHKIVIAVTLGIRTILVSSFLGVLAGGITILAQLSTIESILPSLSVDFIILFYGLIFITILLPIRAKAEAVLKTMD
ncbi:hypothetical protein KHM83_01680 [Fusibacter paucivorans]|uniref:Uncharacterized protein n=1 Tax=Fusibacter paucivorans TaxID=76009 RepID=A0ABS5PKK6_9FIRM|nr:hypothetical protein [Fusibacter paucivorans]MBS7525382.1 hypothetical protein [Fusibacter paucivorans]